MGLTRLSLRRPLTMLMIILALVIMGYQGYNRLLLDSFPAVNFPFVSITVVFPGASPEDVEKLVVKPIEDAVSTISGIDELNSTSVEGVGTIIIAFVEGTDGNAAAIDVERQVASVRSQLPDEAEDPTVGKFDFNAIPVLIMSFTGPQSPETLFDLADETIKPRLQAVQGVASVGVAGGREAEVEVLIDPAKLAAFGVPLGDVQKKLSENNITFPAGSIEEGRQKITVRSVGEFTSLDQIKDVVIRDEIQKSNSGQGPTGRVFLRDVAEVRLGQKDRNSILRYNGRDAISISAVKASDANTVKVVDNIQEAIAEINTDLPPGAELTIVLDNSKFIRESVAAVLEDLFLAVLITGAVILVFLHTVRSTFIVLLAVPSSIMFTFLVMWQLGFSLNQLTLMALTLVIGILVDDSIVVIENIQRHLEMGKPPMQAAQEGRSEIGLAAVTITLVDVVVYLPVAFMSGIVGQFFFSYGVTIAVAAMASLFIAFTLTPMLSGLWLKDPTQSEQSSGESRKGLRRLLLPLDWLRDGYINASKRGINLPALIVAVVLLTGGLFVVGWLWYGSGYAREQMLDSLAQFQAATHSFFLRNLLTQTLAVIIFIGSLVVGIYPMVWLFGLLWKGFIYVFEKAFDLLARFYELTLRFFLYNGLTQALAVIIAAAALYGGISLVRDGFVGSEFFPQEDDGQIRVTIEMPAGTNLDTTDRVARQVENIVLSQVPEISAIQTQVGTGGGGGGPGGGASRSANAATINLVLVDKEDRERSTTDIIEALRPLFLKIPEATIATALNSSAGGPGGSPIQVRIFGNDPNVLIDLANQVEAAMKSVPGTADVKNTDAARSPEAQLIVDRNHALDLGIAPAQVANTLRTALSGSQVGKFQPEGGGTELDITLRMNETARSDVSQLLQIPLKYTDGRPIRLERVVDRGQNLAPARIIRADRQRVLTINSGVAAGSTAGDVTDAVEAAIQQQVQFPTGYGFRFVGTSEIQRETFAQFAQAILLAIVLSYMLLVALYQSWLQPLAIMFALPVTLVGAIGGLYLTNNTLNLISLLGIVLLTGVVTKNAILIVDFTNQLREKEGLARKVALARAGRLRLRAVLMTTLTLVFALLPLLLGAGAGSENRAPLAAVVIGGSISSTALTLILVPVVYNFFDWGGGLMSRFFRFITGAPDPAEELPAEEELPEEERPKEEESTKKPKPSPPSHPAPQPGA